MKAQYAERLKQFVESCKDKDNTCQTVPEWIDHLYVQAYRTLRASMHAHE